MDGKWKYLGSQVGLIDTRIPDDTSPGKYLNVGGSITCAGKFEPLVPRRGDVIIKSTAWKEKFTHSENFWRSMVKWHRDGQIEWAQNDMLLRLLVDKEAFPYPSSSYVSDPPPDPGDHSVCVPHRPCSESHPPPFAGFAELYVFGQANSNMGWVFWGRTPQVYDIPFPKHRHHHLILYVNDDGKDSDLEGDEDEDQQSLLYK